MLTVIETFDDSVCRFPHNVCITDGDSTYTYQEVAHIADVVASHLLAVPRTDELCLIGVYCQRNIFLLPMILGIWKAGLTYVPLNPGDPSEKLTTIARSYRLSLVITDIDDAFTQSLQSHGLLVSPADLTRAAERPPVEAASSSPDALAYLLFTSGSTGVPKGVMISHQALFATLNDLTTELDLSSEMTFLANTTLSFDISLIELFLPLTVSGALYLSKTNLFLSPFELHDTVATKGITHLQATPSALSCITGIGLTFPQGTVLLSGGETLPVNLATELVEMGFDLYNMYGPTETTIWSSCFRVTPDTLRAGRRQGNTVPIGRPLPSEDFYLVDPSTCHPITLLGQEGELAIAGSGLAMGYLYDESKTAQSFVKLTLSGCEKQQVYLTGDLAQKMEDGHFVYVSRIDNQVKIRGHRIELSEIENLSLNHANVAQCSAICQDQRLCLFYKTHDGADCQEELAVMLAKSLPSVALPYQYFLVDSLPLLPSGKTNKLVLSTLLSSTVVP
jgi:amino acid adenylation domain-containing protein